jgi:hypothetical protein
MTELKNSGNAPVDCVLPRKLKPKKLFQLDVDDEVWQDDGLDEKDIGELPRWMGDDSVRRGITAMLQLKRCDEEEARLKHERASMQVWLRQESSYLLKAIRDAQGTACT